MNPDEGILWRGWDEATLGFIAEKSRPVFLFVADRDPTIAPFLRELFRAMPRNAKLRGDGPALESSSAFGKNSSARTER